MKKKTVFTFFMVVIFCVCATLAIAQTPVSTRPDNSFVAPYSTLQQNVKLNIPAKERMQELVARFIQEHLDGKITSRGQGMVLLLSYEDQAKLAGIVMYKNSPDNQGKTWLTTTDGVFKFWPAEDRAAGINGQFVLCVAQYYFVPTTASPTPTNNVFALSNGGHVILSDEYDSWIIRKHAGPPGV